MHSVKSSRAALVCLIAALLLCVYTAAEETAFTGEWAFTHEPEKAVLVLNADGSGSYFGTDILWHCEGTQLYLENEDGSSFALTAEPMGEAMTVYLPAVYERISEIGGEGQIVGTWKAEGDSQSSFVFTDSGKFLEDAVFTGNYLFDEEHAAVTLKYVGGFGDTLIYVSFYEGKLIVGYPWLMIRK